MKFYLVFLFCYVHGLLFAQFNFTYKDSIPVHAFGQQLKMTWSGGLNNAQFSELDFDFDGDNDLLVFDRSADQIRLFENMGSEYRYYPNAASLFPEDIRYRLLSLDYNQDGKNDLFT